MNEKQTGKNQIYNQDRQLKTPLFTGVKAHAEKEVSQFHIPGHKRGKGMDPEYADFIGQNALAIDQINIAPLDDLHHPHGIIDEAQKLAAEAFGADHTFFSVQGTSGAIMTMIMTVCHPGDKIIVPRNVHKSIMSAIVFSGAKPIFIHPELDDELGISHGITVHSVERALRAHPDTKGILVINPTYFGISANLAEIVRIAHLYNVPVMVDEAHGVHIHFSDDMPDSAMQAGADMAATSVHKLGGSLTQSSVLNIQGERIKPERVQTIISMLTTTSTSYILLASLDTARRYLATSGEDEMQRIIRLSHDARIRLNEIDGVHCPGAEMIDHRARYDFDPTKLIISVKDLNVNGYEAEIWLRTYANLEVELSDLYNILCIITLADDEATVDTLIDAIQNMAAYFNDRKFESARQLHQVQVPNIPTLSLSPREAFYAETEIVSLENAAGRISAEFIMIYPPGIPIFIPGEIIEEDNIAYIFRNMDAGLPVQGTEDPTVRTIRVIQERKAIY